MSDATNRMNPSQVAVFLDEPRHAIAAVVRPNGEAQLSPIWFLYEADRLYFTVFQASAKYRHLNREPRITLCIDSGHPDARVVTLRGAAELITKDSPERADLEWRIMRRYHNSDEDTRRYEASIAEQGPNALIAVSPDRITGWDYN